MRFGLAAAGSSSAAGSQGSASLPSLFRALPAGCVRAQRGTSREVRHEADVVAACLRLAHGCGRGVRAARGLRVLGSLLLPIGPPFRGAARTPVHKRQTNRSPTGATGSAEAQTRHPRDPEMRPIAQAECGARQVALAIRLRNRGARSCYPRAGRFGSWSSTLSPPLTVREEPLEHSGQEDKWRVESTSSS